MREVKKGKEYKRDLNKDLLYIGMLNSMNPMSGASITAAPFIAKTINEQNKEEDAENEDEPDDEGPKD